MAEIILFIIIIISRLIISLIWCGSGSPRDLLRLPVALPLDRNLEELKGTMNISASGTNDDEKLSFVDSSSLSSNNYSRSAGRIEEEGGVVTYFQSANHPTAAFFHIFFKTLAMLAYLFGSWFVSNTVLIFVVCVVLLALTSGQ